VAEELEKSSRDRFRAAISAPGSNPEDGSQVQFREQVNGLKKTAETGAILKALGRTNWNRKEAAKLLNITYKSLLYRMKVLEIGSR